MIASTQIRARYAETDQMGIIHHAVYPVWYEERAPIFAAKSAFPIPKWRRWG